MANKTFDLGKLRFNFVGDYIGDTYYEYNDVVRYGGNIYVYVHPLVEKGVLPTTTTHWSLVVIGFKFKGVYDVNTPYKVGEAVSHGANIYVCIDDAVGATPPNDSKWSLFLEGTRYMGHYNQAIGYKKNDVINYGVNTYVAKVDTVGNLPTSATYWTLVQEGVDPRGIYNNTVQYHKNDICTYGGKAYIALKDTVGNLPTSADKWDIFVSGLESRGDWSAATLYHTDSIVSYGGNSYISLAEHTSTQSFLTDLSNNKWSKFNGGVRWRGMWVAGVRYYPDDMVSDGINTLIALTEFVSGDISAGADGVYPTADPKWDILAKGATGVPTITVPQVGMQLTATLSGPVWGLRTAKSLFIQSQI